MNRKGYGRRRAWSSLRYNSGFYQELLRKPTSIFSQSSLYPGRECTGNFPLWRTQLIFRKRLSVRWWWGNRKITLLLTSPCICLLLQIPTARCFFVNKSEGCIFPTFSQKTYLAEHYRQELWVRDVLQFCCHNASCLLEKSLVAPVRVEALQGGGQAIVFP